MFRNRYTAQVQDTFNIASWVTPPFLEAHHALIATTWTPPVPSRIEEPTELLYAHPPPFVFTRTREDLNQTRPTGDTRLENMFFIWVCIRKQCVDHPERWWMTTTDWKTILSGAYFRHLHPPGETFDLNFFWKHGWGKKFDPCTEQDPVPMLLGERLTPSRFQNTDLRKVIVHDLYLTSIKYQFERTNAMLRGEDVEYWGEPLFKRDPSVIDFSSYPNPLSTTWMLMFGHHISQWPQFKNAAGRLPLIDDGMPGAQEMTSRTIAYLRAYFQGVQDCLRTVPTVFYPTPDVPPWFLEACTGM